MRGQHEEEHGSHCEILGQEALLSKGGNSVRQGLYRRVGVGLLTNVCKRPQPRFAVFSIIARHTRLGAFVRRDPAGQGAVGSPETKR